MKVGCLLMHGIRREREGLLDLFTDTAPEPNEACATANRERLGRLSQLMNGPARLLVAANGHHLLLADEEHWLVGLLDQSPAGRR